MDTNKLFEDCRALCEALKMKKLAKFSPRNASYKVLKWNIEIDGKLIGRIERSGGVYGDDRMYSWSVHIYKPGTKDTGQQYATDYLDTRSTEDPNEAFKKLAMSSRTRKSTIKSIEAHGVTVKNLNKKHFKKAA